MRRYMYFLSLLVLISFTQPSSVLYNNVSKKNIKEEAFLAAQPIYSNFSSSAITNRFLAASVEKMKISPTVDSQQTLTGDTAIEVDSGEAFTCALMSSGKVKCWGDNSFGQLGDGTKYSRKNPKDVYGIENSIEVAVGNYHACALLQNGEVKCWGRNAFGQLGNGTFRASLIPVNAQTTETFKQVTSNGEDTCAVTNNNGVLCWGMNEHGELGDTTNINRSTPVFVYGLQNGVLSIATGPYHTCAILSLNKSVVCWGSNPFGELGDETSQNRFAPVPVAHLSEGALQVSAGGNHTCALSILGNIWCWGWNEYGQLGNGNNSNSYIPVLVFGITKDIKEISTRLDHNCTLFNSGKLMCWGHNNHGQLGDRTNTNRNFPVQVTGLISGVSDVIVGNLTSCVVMESGGIKCWGDNTARQVGDGTTIEQWEPVDVVNLNKIYCIPLPNAIQPKVLIINYNPWLNTKEISLFENESEFNSLATSEQARLDFCEESGGFVNIKIVGLMDRNEFPMMTNGKRMTEAEYLQLRNEGKTYSQLYPNAEIDYAYAVRDGDLQKKIKNNEVDEIWLFLSWTMSGYESLMGGPGAFSINGPIFDIDSGKAFAIMGFENAGGGTLHSFGHRIEGTFDKAYGVVYDQQDTPWARFRKYSNSGWLPNAPIAAGDTEHPPNARSTYDYDNTEPVISTADDWFNYPNLTGATTIVSALDWEKSDYLYYKWWFRHFPKAEGVSARAESAPNELRQNNWWKYIFQYYAYPELVGITAPSNLSLSTISQTQIRLSWTDNSMSESDFHVERSLSGSSDWTEIATVGVNSTNFNDFNLTCGTNYYYRIRAHDNLNNIFSNYSNIASSTTQTCNQSLKKYFLPAVSKTVTTSSYKTTIDAKVEWQDTGINVKQGDQIRVSYLSGLWSIWDTVDPNTDAIGQNGRHDGCTYLPSANTGALIGGISTTSIYMIGNSGSFMASTDGTIHLSINDCKGEFGNNNGSITVNIVVLSGS